MTLRQWLAQGPFTLAMSSGFFSFYAHTGMMCGLTKQGFRPRKVAGSSAGALVAGLWAAGIEGEAMANILRSLNRNDFWDPKPGLGLLAGNKFDALLRRIMPIESFARTRVPVAISVFDVLARKTKVQVQGDLAIAIRASCAVPALFSPVWISGRPCIDGGVADRHGLAGVDGEPRILYHHISSRSPWRRKGSAALEVPNQPNIRSLVIDGLPRSGPFRLEQGMKALETAAQATEQALDIELLNRTVVVAASVQ